MVNKGEVFFLDSCFLIIPGNSPSNADPSTHTGRCPLKDNRYMMCEVKMRLCRMCIDMKETERTGAGQNNIPHLKSATATPFPKH